jgi:hypothetical protein
MKEEAIRSNDFVDEAEVEDSTEQTPLAEIRGLPEYDESVD